MTDAARVAPAWALHLERRWRNFIEKSIGVATIRWHDLLGKFFHWPAALPVIPEVGELVRPDELVLELHWCNHQIWHHEDLARSRADAYVAGAKRNIDVLNQRRNDLIEAIDEVLVGEQMATGDYNSETLGSILDRCSVTALKTYHTRCLIVANRDRGDLALVDNLRARNEVLSDQLDFLGQHADLLYFQMKHGLRRTRVFRQLKLYNSPHTNPYVNS